MQTFCAIGQTNVHTFSTGLNNYTTDARLIEAFAPFGRLVEAKIIRDVGTQRSKGFAIVTYATIYEAERARQAMNGKFLDGWSIVVNPAKPTELRCPSYSELHRPSELRLPSKSELHKPREFRLPSRSEFQQQLPRELRLPSKSEFQHQQPREYRYFLLNPNSSSSSQGSTDFLLNPNSSISHGM